jgi:hypothetical protein
MSLVSGPGKAPGTLSDQKLCIEKHVDYIKKLDSVRHPQFTMPLLFARRRLTGDGSGKMS